MHPSLVIALGSTAVILGIWLGYPTVMLMLASTRRRRMPATGALPSLSVVIATRDHQEAVARKLRSVLAAEYPQDCLEVIVAVDSAVPCPERVPGIDDPRVRLVPSQGAPGKPAALNAGVAAARGEIVVLTDTHQLLHPGALTALARAFDGASIGVVSGFLELKPGATVSPLDAYWRLERQLRWAEGQVSSSVGVTGALYAIRRDLWPTLPQSVLLDDVYVPMSVVLRGHRVIVEPGAIAMEQREASPELELHRKARTLAGNIQLLHLQPEILNPLRNPIWLQFMLHKLARLLTPFLIALQALSVLALVVEGTSHDRARLLLVALFAALALAVLSAKGRQQLRWLVYLQAATLMGIYYGMRQRADVWRR